MFSKAIGLDAKGDVYMTGYFNDTLEVGKTKISQPSGSQDVFLTKLVPQSLWSMEQHSGSVAGVSELTSCDLEHYGERLRVKFVVAETASVRLSLVDMLGNTAGAYVDEDLQSGSYEVTVDLKSVPRDAYYARLVIGTSKFSKRIEF
jgi:hypothetical protein